MDENKTQQILKEIEKCGLQEPRYEETVKHQRIRISTTYVHMDTLGELIGLCHNYKLQFNIRSEREHFVIDIWDKEK